MNFTRTCPAALLAAVLLLGGCKAREKAVSEHDRKESALLATEAQTAIQLKDWPRAESLLAKATQLNPDGAYFISLGSMRRRLGNRAGAKEAYEGAINWCKIEEDKNPTDAEPWLKHAYLLALIGKPDEGRALLQKTEKRFPNDRKVRAFIDGKQFDAMIAGPNFKESAL